MTKYSVSVLNNGEWNGVAMFADTINFHAIVAFCYEQFECGKSATTPGEDMVITDLETGEIVWSWSEAQDGAYDEEWLDDPYDVEWDDHYWDDGCLNDDVDESNYDPYAGCDMYEVEPFDFGGDY